MHRSPFFASSRLRALTSPSLASPWSVLDIWRENASSYNNSYELTQQRGICGTDDQFRRNSLRSGGRNASLPAADALQQHPPQKALLT